MNSLHNHNLQILNALNKEREKTREEKEVALLEICRPLPEFNATERK